jgi:predicted amidophosphoribosyltransferase
MSKINITDKARKTVKDTGNKIQYGESKNLCFACGEKIDSNTKICPYCKTKQNEKESILKQ